ncbi:hypothetical protein [Streptomyces fructofermentans]|uniref:hypothetical protein n=1 Tax=Streptomyces fructofermentans TaxID=152141 RepID=UPI00379A5F79
MDNTDIAVVAVVVVAISLVAVVTVLLRGRMAGEARALGARLRLSARRDSPPETGNAVIKDSSSKVGGATAEGPNNARISGTKVRKDLIARVRNTEEDGGKRKKD